MNELEIKVQKLEARIDYLEEAVERLRGYISPFIPLGPTYPSNLFSKIPSKISDEDKTRLIEKIKEMKKIKDCKNLK